MNTEIATQPAGRREKIEALKQFLQNPGLFSILLLGERGTGKSHWLDSLIGKEKKVILHTVCVEDNFDFWDRVFAEAHNGYLIIESVDKLSKRSQEILEMILSTHNGYYGVSKKEYFVRIVFTSHFDITALRDSEEFLSHSFFDRIAQLVTKLPSFEENGRNIWNDFEATWQKMKFGKKFKMPDENLQIWLEKQSQHFHGNFRDLDKIAINWHQHQLNGISDSKKISELVKKDFEELWHFPEQKTEMHDTFDFEKGQTKDELEKKWRGKFKEWAKREYGTLQKAAKELQMSVRTFEKW